MKSVEAVQVSRELRETKRALRDLTDWVLIFIANLDVVVGPRKDIPRDVSSLLGKMAGALDERNDRARYTWVDFRTDNKRTALRRACRRLNVSAEDTARLLKK